MALVAGILRVTLNYAKDIADRDRFGRQDPYVRLRVGSQEKRSQVCKRGGLTPVWDEVFDFDIINDNTLEMTLMDKDTFTRDDLIGTSTVSLAKVRAQGHDTVQAPVSDGKNTMKQQGFVQVKLSFIPNSKLGDPGQPASQPMAMHVPAAGYPSAAPPFAPAQPAAYGYGCAMAMPAPVPAPAQCGHANYEYENVTKYKYNAKV